MYRCRKRHQPTVSVDFGGREPSRNYEDETPSTKFARLLPRVWKGMRESIKRLTNWSVKYFTHRKSYYPVPELAMDLSTIAKLTPIPVVPMDKVNIAKMREWASEHGQCVRQLTVRQQTTKFSAGTLPMSAYGLNLPQDPLESNVEEVIEGEEEEIIEEYDSDSDSDLRSSHMSEDDDEESDYAVPSILTTRTRLDL